MVNDVATSNGRGAVCVMLKLLLWSSFQGAVTSTLAAPVVVTGEIAIYSPSAAFIFF
jgi:hypothetical protein